MAGDSVSAAIICEKARLFYCDNTRDKSSSSAEEFKARKGWFDNFKKRTGIHSVVRHGEAASSNKDAADYRQSLETSFSQNDAICLEKKLASLRGL